MDEQRCSAPVLQNQAEQEKFFKMISHAQSGRMDEQRCSLQPSRSAEADAFFKVIASSQARRLDDQRVTLPTLPGISSERKENGRNTKAGIPVSYTTIRLLVVKDCSRPTSQPRVSNAASGSPRALPKSASFTPETEYQKNLNSPGQVTCSPQM
uniref:Uncharacterized protein n=1 Tax=Lates calcarifer TaxID=8187 RepID=A0A4W6FP28_LATCA